MIKNVGIFYFSGTGCTKLLVEMTADYMREAGATVDVIRIEDLMKHKQVPEVEKYEVIGIAHPTYGFDAPEIIHDFVGLMPEAAGQKVFIARVATAKAFINNGASYYVRKALIKKGYDVFNERQLVMAPNWLVSYPDEVAKQLYEVSFRKTKALAGEVLELRRKSDATGILKGILPIVARGERYAGRKFGESLRVSEACISCGKCSRECPRGNITQEGGKIKFGANCMMCMRCVYSCPAKAIYSKGFSFFILKGGFDIDRIIKDPDIKGDSVTAKTKGYYKRILYNYLFKD